MAGQDAGPPGQVGRGPGRASGRGEPLAPAGAPDLGGVRRGRPDPRAGRRHPARQRRLLSHARDHGARTDRGDAAGPLPGARVPRPDPGPAHQQDPVRHLPCAGPVRGNHGPRAVARHGRRPDRHRPRGVAPAKPARPPRAALPPAADHAGHRRGAGYRGLPGAAGRGRGRGRAAGVLRDRGGRARGRAAARAGARRVPGEERPRPAGHRGRAGQQDRHRARVLRRDLAGAGHRDRACPDRRRRARRRARRWCTW